MTRFISLLILLFVTGIPAAAQDSAVDDARGAIEFIETLANETQAIWSDSKLTSQERSGAFRVLFEQATDIKLLAKGMLGRHYRSLSKTQREDYMAAMRDYIVSEFDQRMEQVGFKSLEVVGTKAASGRRGHLFVKTQIMRDEGEPILADWRVRKKAGAFQIVNLEFEGINLMIINRDVFSSKVNKNGIDGLIAWLKSQSAPTLTASATE